MHTCWAWRTQRCLARIRAALAWLSTRQTPHTSSSRLSEPKNGARAGLCEPEHTESRGHGGASPRHAAERRGPVHLRGSAPTKARRWCPHPRTMQCRAHRHSTAKFYLGTPCTGHCVVMSACAWREIEMRMRTCDYKACGRDRPPCVHRPRYIRCEQYPITHTSKCDSHRHVAWISI